MGNTCEPSEDAVEEAKIGTKIWNVDRDGAPLLLLELFPPFKLRQDEYDPNIVWIVSGEGVMVGLFLRSGIWELRGELTLAK